MPRTVLVVEDEPLIALDLQFTLEDLGWEVLGPVGTVRAALVLLETQTPSVATLDINLGNELVVPVARVLQERKIPFIFASAFADIGSLSNGDFAMVTNIGKPIVSQHLAAALITAMNR